MWNFSLKGWFWLWNIITYLLFLSLSSWLGARCQTHFACVFSLYWRIISPLTAACRACDQGGRRHSVWSPSQVPRDVFHNPPLLHTISPLTNASSLYAKVARQCLLAPPSRLVEPVLSHRAASSSLKGRSLPTWPPDSGTRCSRGCGLKCNRWALASHSSPGPSLEDAEACACMHAHAHTHILQRKARDGLLLPVNEITVGLPADHSVLWFSCVKENHTWIFSLLSKMTVKKKLKKRKTFPIPPNAFAMLLLFLHWLHALFFQPHYKSSVCNLAWFIIFTFVKV